MAASLVVPHWRPLTLTDRRNDITTVGSHSTPVGFTQRDVRNRTPGFVALEVQSGSTVRREILRMQSLPAPAWLEPTLNNCGHLLLLPADWDGAHAPVIDTGAIQAALDALCSFMADDSSAPQWTPTRDGGVQLDWHENGLDLEIEFSPDKAEGYAVFEDHREGCDEWDGPVSQHMEWLRSIFAGRLNARVSR